MQKLHDLDVDFGQGFGIAKPEIIDGTRPPTEQKLRMPPELSA
jgi:hypothetical protein